MTENVNNPVHDVTDLLSQLAESVRTLNAVNYDILRVINDDRSRLNEADNNSLEDSISFTEKIMKSEKLMNPERNIYSGNKDELDLFIGQLRHFIMMMKLVRTKYEIKNLVTHSENNTDSYSERQATIQANRKKLRDKRKKKK